MKSRNGLDLTEAGEEVRKMIATLGWERYHSTSNLAIAIVVEASELLAKLQWRSDKDIDMLIKSPETQHEVSSEMGDIMINLLSLCGKFNIDLNSVIVAKCHRITQRFISRKGISHGASRNDLHCVKCGSGVIADWCYCAACGNNLVQKSQKQ